MTKKVRIKKATQTTGMRVLVASSVATILINFNFGTFNLISHPAIHADTVTTAIQYAIPDEQLAQVKMVGPYHDNIDGSSAQIKQVRVAGVFHTGDLVQMMIDNIPYVGVVPSETIHGFVLTTFNNLIGSNIDVVVEGRNYQGTSVGQNTKSKSDRQTITK
ncbi:hypothetical protein H9L19_08000 [Weissella diestrammenae]|uniref:Uncharacterized protein n=1 Tax=Weissella diestrammenae TaxID=1162633 RepID=A0A7G9T5B7_9LACO|nr:hypothetical protein [Weissella diestrammenae]MCM0583150.1 hypothetical protein [Weissella diestrammenae]QNN75292.1 hypothetical protein H9L19_08000 [Weissella diestrammenae]